VNLINKIRQKSYRIEDSLTHYYWDVGIRKPHELIWRVFAYEVLRWPDGIKPRGK